ncbi:MAG: hypothetical protein R3D56_07075 [Paracoccaceae bacterium]
MTFRRTLFTLGLVTLTAGALPALAEEPAMYAMTSAGEVLTNKDGMTLYTFDKDSDGVSACYDDCAAKWPPYTAAADAVAEGDYGMIERTDGTRQWTYDGKPLYTYAEDTKAGDVMGDGKNGVWHVVKAE